MIVLIIVLSVLLTAVLIGLIVPYYIVFYSPHRNADEIETEPFLDDMDMFNEIKAQARKLSAFGTVLSQVGRRAAVYLLSRLPRLIGSSFQYNRAVPPGRGLQCPSC